MKEIIVAGLTGGRKDPVMKDLIEQSSLLVCSASIQALLRGQAYELDHLEWVSVTPLKECLARIQNVLEDTQVLVVTSGDPLFFGIGRLLKNYIPDGRIRFIPAVSTMQLCFSRFGIPWDDAVHISLHGRAMERLKAQSATVKLFIFTDPRNNPERIARYLLQAWGEYGCRAITVYVGEQLGTEQERLYHGTVAEIARMEFQDPNCMIMVNRGAAGENGADRSRFGLKEENITHSRGLITKNEVRAAVLHALELPEKGVLWDIDAGSGSVSIEAARMFPGLNIYSIEKRQVEQANISVNRDRYRCFNIDIVDAEAPTGLETLPKVDRIFIGGSGGKLEEIIRVAHTCLCDGGHIVMTAVTDKSLEVGPRILHELGYRVNISEIAVRRFNYPLEEELILNPIHLIVAKQTND